MKYRVERDSMGEVNVPEKALWGAQTERSHINFNIGTETMPLNYLRKNMSLLRRPVMKYIRENMIKNFL